MGLYKIISIFSVFFLVSSSFVQAANWSCIGHSNDPFLKDAVQLVEDTINGGRGLSLALYGTGGFEYKFTVIEPEGPKTYSDTNNGENLGFSFLRAGSASRIYEYRGDPEVPDYFEWVETVGVSGPLDSFSMKAAGVSTTV